jgi:hypothetical protein
MADIFISYKREEQPVAKKLADALQKKGWSVWWDPEVRACEKGNKGSKGIRGRALICDYRKPINN